jgi:cholestenol Delta-isomerase
MGVFEMLKGSPVVPSALPRPPHPYYPTDAVLSGGFVPNDRETTELLAVFAAIYCCVFATILWIAGRRQLPMSLFDKITLLWFVLCGTLHTFFEGYFVANHHRIASMPDLFGQLWKEYALSDSRYLTSDTFVLSAETMSVFVLGSLSFLMVFLIATSNPYRYSVQIIVSTGHIYSDALYYLTSFVDHYYKDVSVCRPEPYYFWLYYFGMNFVWIVVPVGK